MELPKLSEYYLIEAVDLDRTWNAHKDDIVARAHEGRHDVSMERSIMGSMDTSVPASKPWDQDLEAQKSARQTIHDNVVRHYQYQAQTPQNLRQETHDRMHSQSAPMTAETHWKDKHETASRIRGAETFHLADMRPELREKAGKEFMGLVAEAAPHPKYIPTITKMYANGSIKRMEDIPTQAAEAFKQYHQLSTHGRLNPDRKVMDTSTGNVVAAHPDEWGGKESFDAQAALAKRMNPSARKPIPETDFKRFESLKDVRAVVGHAAHTEFLAKQRLKELDPTGHTVVHEDDDVTIYHPHTHEASVSLAFCPHTGKKAVWCTAADSEGGKRFFDQYSKQGPLLIYHPKQPEHAGEMYQTHHASDQFMNEHDNDVEYYHLASDTPGLGIVKHADFDKETQVGMPDEVHGRVVDTGKPKARFPNFNSSSALAYSHKHMYDHPEKYNSSAATQHDAWVEDRVGLRAGTKPLNNTFAAHVAARNPMNQNSGHWATSSDEVKDKSRPQIKDPVAYDAALKHHRKVLAHYIHRGHDDEDDEDNE